MGLRPDPGPPVTVAGIYIDNKCPFTGNVSIRGRILSGEAVFASTSRGCLRQRSGRHRNLARPTHGSSLFFMRSWPRGPDGPMVLVETGGKSGISAVGGSVRAGMADTPDDCV